MTDMRPDDWDDTRLDAAFARRAGATPPTPPTLLDDVVGRTAQRRGGIAGWAPVPAMLGVLVVIGVLTGMLGPRTHRPGASGAPSGFVAPPESLSPVLAAIGDPITVSAAVAIRDAGMDSREIAVAGFLSPEPRMSCPLESSPRNPTRLWCSAADVWLMENQEQLWGPGVTGNHRPTGPAINPSFAVAEMPNLAMPQTEEDLPLSVVLIGHFDDRRARLCVSNKDDCADVFVVDRVASVDGATPGTTSTSTEETPQDNELAVDALVAAVAPGSLVLSRQVLRVGEAIDVEPLLSNDELIPSADPSKLAWIVTVVQLLDGAPAVRTFMLLDGSSWFAEITAAVVKQLPWPLPEPTDGSGPVQPSANPDAFDGAPTSVLGIPVRDIATLERDRKALMDQGGRDEVALRAWYVAPNPTIICDDQPPFFHEPRPPCDEARHWLLDDPSQFGIMQGQIRRDPSIDHFPPVLNPLLPIDVAFDVGSTWNGEGPLPRPVIVLGHFGDHRVDTYAGNLYFVIDALAWTPDQPNRSLDTVTRLTPDAHEDVADVIARIDAASPRDALATWVTVARASDLEALDRRSEYLSEFTSGAPVWMVARLVLDETDGRRRLAVVWAWTADGGTRVWADGCPDCSPDLATTLDMHDLDAETPLVRVFDYSQALVAAGSASGLTSLDWQKPHGNSVDFMDVARGRTSREVVLRWRSPTGCPSPWDLRVYRTNDGRFDGDDVYLSPTISGECGGDPVVVRRIVLEFKDPVDIDRISGPSCCG